MNQASPMSRIAVDTVIGHDLPGLPDDRRREVVAFVDHRFRTLPHHMRLGVAVLDAVFSAVHRLVGVPRFASFSRVRLPLVAEYFRLVRSLGYAFVWEKWPDTAADGTPM